MHENNVVTKNIQTSLGAHSGSYLQDTRGSSPVDRADEAWS